MRERILDRLHQRRRILPEPPLDLRFHRLQHRHIGVRIHAASPPPVLREAQLRPLRMPRLTQQHPDVHEFVLHRIRHIPHQEELKGLPFAHSKSSIAPSSTTPHPRPTLHHPSRQSIVPLRPPLHTLPFISRRPIPLWKGCPRRFPKRQYQIPHPRPPP